MNFYLTAFSQSSYQKQVENNKVEVVVTTSGQRLKIPVYGEISQIEPFQLA